MSLKDGIIFRKILIRNWTNSTVKNISSTPKLAALQLNWD